MKQTKKKKMPIFLEVRNKSPALLPLKPLRYITVFWLLYSLNPRHRDSHILAWSSSGNVAQLVANLGNGPTLSILPSWAQSRQNRDYISQPYLQVGVAMWLLLNMEALCYFCLISGSCLWPLPLSHFWLTRKWQPTNAKNPEMISTCWESRANRGARPPR